MVSSGDDTSNKKLIGILKDGTYTQLIEGQRHKL